MPEDINALKAISKTDDELRVANYIVLFGGRDLTGLVHGKNKDGSLGEYFTKATDFESPYTQINQVLVDWEHGLREDNVEPGSDDVLGYVDWKTARMDDKGLFVDRVLNRRNQYVQWLETLIEDGLIGNSTEATRKNVRINDNGEIIRWPIKRDTFTVVPMEPRMLGENTVQALKSLGVNLESLLPAVEAGAAESGDEPDKQIQADDLSIQNTQGETTMAEELDIQAIAKAAADEAVKAFAASLPAEKTAGYAGVTVSGDEADRALAGNPFKSGGEYLQYVKNAAYGDEDKRLKPLRSDDGMYSMNIPLAGSSKSWFKAATGLNEAQSSEGGYLVKPTYSAGIVERMYSIGQLLPKVNWTNLGPNSNRMTLPAVDETSRVDGSRLGGVRGYWMDEAGTKTASQPKFREMNLILHKVAALVYATDELLQDATALESWLLNRVPQELVFKTEDALYNGDGVGKPLGFMNSPAIVTVTRDTGSKVLAADLFAMWARFWMGSRGSSGAAWMVGPDTETQLHQLYLQTGIQFPFYTIDAQGVQRLFGLPLITNEYSPALNTTGDIALVDFAQIEGIRKGGIEAASSIHVNFVTDETAYRWVYRVDAQPAWNSALTMKNGSAGTLSPFVVLGSAT